jgi:hypothetical protein
VITRRLRRGICYALLALLSAGCAIKADYTNFRLYPPRSILVLPPLNHSTAVEATYGYLSTVTKPLAEMGYYVFPVAVVDQFLKENGMPTPGEMHQVPVNKAREVLGTDAVLFITVEEYGTKYMVITSSTIVRAKAKLIDTKTGITIWEGTGVAQEASGGSGDLMVDLVAAVIHQIVNASTDNARNVSRLANYNLLTVKDRGLLYGPYHPKHGTAD